MPSTEEVKAAIGNAIPCTFLSVDEISTDGGASSSFTAVVVSAEFAGKPLLQCHRRVNESLKPLMGGIHAFTLKTFTPEQYEKSKQ